MHWGNHRLFISSILAFALHLVDGCGRTPARPKPTASPVPDDETTRRPGPPTTRMPNPNKHKCTTAEIREAGCLNGGTCFAVNLHNVRTGHCDCLDMWIGTRCERIDGKFFVLPAKKMRIAGIATGVSAVVIVLAVIIAYVLILRRFRNKRRQEAAQNGYVCKPFIQDGTNSEHAPCDRHYCKSDTNRISVDHSRYDHNYHDDVDNHTNGDHRSYNMGNSETHV